MGLNMLDMKAVQLFFNCEKTMGESPCEMVKASRFSNIFACNSKISMEQLQAISDPQTHRSSHLAVSCCFYFWSEGSTTHGGGWCSPSRADADGRPL